MLGLLLYSTDTDVDALHVTSLALPRERELEEVRIEQRVQIHAVDLPWWQWPVLRAIHTTVTRNLNAASAVSTPSYNLNDDTVSKPATCTLTFAIASDFVARKMPIATTAASTLGPVAGMQLSPPAEGLILPVQCDVAVVQAVY
jgi:hypothetical protein